MKRILSIFLAIIIVTTPLIAGASDMVGFSGGVYNEYEYEEVVFITGEPIKFVGEIEVEIEVSEDGNTDSIDYDLDLEPEDKSIEGELRRSITIDIDNQDRNDKGQVIANAKLSKYREDIEIGDLEFELEDYQLSKSDVIDKRPASDFYSGNIKGRKYYTINDDEGKVIVDITGGNVGYENFWGNTQTQIIDYNITSETPQESWQGTVRVQISDSTTKELRYSNNQANLSSFNGGYIRTTNREIVSKYNYDLPDTGEDSMSLSRKMVPKVERLIVPKFRDLGGHWAQSYIEKLYSLDVLEEASSFFTPNIPMTRGEFTKAIMKACNIRTSLEQEDTRSINRQRTTEEEEKSPFLDVPIGSENYEYIKEAHDKGIITGNSKGMYKPKEPITRAQAITLLIRALGFTNKAPTPGYYTTFRDDEDIQSWAKDSIYVAKEIGLVQGDNQNKINPNKEMTRAEASAMLVGLLEFLQRDLQKDYREKIILFN